MPLLVKLISLPRLILRIILGILILFVFLWAAAIGLVAYSILKLLTLAYDYLGYAPVKGTPPTTPFHR